MKEGFWLNYKTDQYFPVREHEMWLRTNNNAQKLGLPPKVINSFPKFKPRVDRNKLLLFVLQHSPVIRVRGHGGHVTFEFSSRKIDPIFSIYDFGERIGFADYTNLLIVNFGLKEESRIIFSQLKKMVKEDRLSEISRAASKIELKESIVSELEGIASEL